MSGIIIDMAFCGAVVGVIVWCWEFVLRKAKNGKGYEKV